MASIRIDRGMTATLRYRLIQILEIVLWLGILTGLLRLVLRLLQMREQGWRAMLDLAGPAVLAGGAVAIALILLIGIYHNGRRNADALDRLARQNAGGVRRLAAVSRAEEAPAAAQEPAKADMVKTHDAPRFGPAPELRPRQQAAPTSQPRRIGPAN